MPPTAMKHASRPTAVSVTLAKLLGSDTVTIEIALPTMSRRVKTASKGFALRSQNPPE